MTDDTVTLWEANHPDDEAYEVGMSRRTFRKVRCFQCNGIAHTFRIECDQCESNGWMLAEVSDG